MRAILLQPRTSDRCLYRLFCSPPCPVPFPSAQRIHWTEPATADDFHAALEKTLWDVANQLWSNAALKPTMSMPSSSMASAVVKAGFDAESEQFPRRLGGGELAALFSVEDLRNAPGVAHGVF